MQVPAYIKTVLETATCLYTHTEVEMALDQMAIEMNAALIDSNPLFLCVLVGGIIPLGCLLPRLNFPLEVDYLHATRYQGKTSGGELQWIAKHRKALKDRTIVIVDDILDTGITLKIIMDACIAEGASKIYSAVLVDKIGARLPEGLPAADFTGLQVDNRYVFGYGLDYKEYLRNAPGIYAVAPEFQ